MAPAGQWRVELGTTWQVGERFQDTVEFTNDGGIDFGSESATSLKMNDDRLHLASVAYGLHRRLTLLVQVGMAEGGTIAETLSNGLWEAKLKPVFAWGIGARGLLWEHPNGLGLTAGFSYLRYDDRGIDHWSNNTDGLNTDVKGYGVEGRVDYWRVEARLLAQSRLGRWLPFLGVGYSYSELKDVDTWSRPDGSWSRYDFSTLGKDRLGLLAGVEAEIGSGLSLRLSGTLFSREELGLSLIWDF
jgi:hypothetical protein